MHLYVPIVYCAYTITDDTESCVTSDSVGDCCYRHADCVYWYHNHVSEYIYHLLMYVYSDCLQDVYISAPTIRLAIISLVYKLLLQMVAINVHGF